MVQTQLRQILTAHGRLTVDVSSLADDSDLFAAGLTSLSTVNLLLAVEDEFDIEVPDHLLSTRTFQSIHALADVVNSLRR